MLIDAAGEPIAHDRCLCRRHKYAAELYCCGPCGGTGERHSVSCQMVQEHFPDTRRGVRVAPEASLLPVGDLTRSGFVVGTGQPRTENGRHFAPWSA